MYHIQLIHLRIIKLCVTSGLLLHPPGAATELTAMVPVAFTVLAVLVGLLLMVVVGVVIPVVCTRLCIQRRRKNAYYSMWALHRTPYTYIILCTCLLYMSCVIYIVRYGDPWPIFMTEVNVLDKLIQYI